MPTRSRQRPRWLLGQAAIIAGIVGGCLAPAIGATAPSPADGLVHYADGKIGFDYPATWTASHPALLVLGTQWVVELSSVPTAELCGPEASATGNPSAAPCLPPFILSPDTVVVDVRLSTQRPGSSGAPFARAQPATIDGSPGYFETRPAFPRYAVDEDLHWAIAARDPGAVYEIEAYLRGPNLARLDAQVRAIVTSFQLG